MIPLVHMFRHVNIINIKNINFLAHVSGLLLPPENTPGTGEGKRKLCSV